MLGLSLPSLLQLQSASGAESIAAGGLKGGGPGWGKAKSIIMVYLQGGPSPLDLWDPKENVPDNVKSVFANISTKLPGVKFTEKNSRFTGGKGGTGGGKWPRIYVQFPGRRLHVPPNDKRQVHGTNQLRERPPKRGIQGADAGAVMTIQPTKVEGPANG